MCHPLRSDRPGRDGQDNDLLEARLAPELCHQLIRLWQLEALPVPALLGVPRSTHHGHVSVRSTSSGRRPSHCRILDTGLEALDRCDLLPCFYVAAATARVDVALSVRALRLLVAILADESDLFTAGHQRQGGSLILQEDSAVDDSLLRHLQVSGACSVRAYDRMHCCALFSNRGVHVGLGDGEPTIELARDVHGGQYMENLLIDESLCDRTGLEESWELVELVGQPLDGVGPLHVDVETGQCRPQSVMGRAPIADHVAPEARIRPQQLLQQLAVLASMHAVDLVVGAHQAGSTGVKGRLEDRHVDLVLSTVGHLGIHGEAENLLVVVKPVLHCGDDATVLDRLDERLHKLAAEVRVLTRDGLKAAACECGPRDLDVGAKEHVRALGDELLGDSGGVAPCGFGIEARGHSKEGRELCGGPRRRAVGVEALRPIVHA
mmetsp:Transcript_28197/g.59698  ORF Transcript_28197/g.59698 Transcript_28197/m.59698 type:complete len:436 (+) Transcript_28197:730-2037(+)